MSVNHLIFGKFLSGYITELAKATNNNSAIFFQYILDYMYVKKLNANDKVKLSLAEISCNCNLNYTEIINCLNLLNYNDFIKDGYEVNKDLDFVFIELNIYKVNYLLGVK